MKDKNQKIQTVFVRMSPIMETLTGVMIAVLIFYSGKLMSNGELDINNFFILGCNDASLPTCEVPITLNMVLNQGLSAQPEFYPL